jgi:hypothetical protein
MTELVVSGLVVTIGLIAVGVGVATATSRLRTAKRAYRRTAALHTAVSEGWGAWFVSGFSGITMGTQWLSAVTAWFIWTLAGVGLITLGIRLFSRV